MLIFPTFIAIAVLGWLAYRVGKPLFQRKPRPLPVAIGPNIDALLQHISVTYGLSEHDEAHDEADGPAPALPVISRKQRKPQRVPTTIIKPDKVVVLASALRIPAEIIYARGQHAGERRNILILQALGRHGVSGEMHVQTVRCICTKAQEFRAFRLDCISELIDGETGEFVADIPAWLDGKLAALV